MAHERDLLNLRRKLEFGEHRPSLGLISASELRFYSARIAIRWEGGHPPTR